MPLKSSKTWTMSIILTIFQRGFAIFQISTGLVLQLGCSSYLEFICWNDLAVQCTDQRGSPLNASDVKARGTPTTSQNDAFEQPHLAVQKASFWLSGYSEGVICCICQHLRECIKMKYWAVPKSATSSAKMQRISKRQCIKSRFQTALMTWVQSVQVIVSCSKSLEFNVCGIPTAN